MSIILNINTATSEASVSISAEGKVLSYIKNDDQREHASFIQPAVKKLLSQLHIKLDDLNAIAVVNGPGSYTGLRVGISSAKGICYALKKPLITIGSLPLMSKAAILQLEKDKKNIPLLCPMIDARRMEVFTAIHNEALKEILPAQAIILTNQSFVDFILQDEILFFGNGAAKFQPLTNHSNALFARDYNNIEAMALLSFQHYSAHQFTDLAYSEPLYLKEFFPG